MPLDHVLAKGSPFQGWLRAFGLGLAMTISACAPGRDLQPLPNYQATAYRFGGGDRIRIITYGEDQLTGEFRVDDQGRIAVPLLGGIVAAGRTPEELEAVIAAESQPVA